MSLTFYVPFKLDSPIQIICMYIIIYKLYFFEETKLKMNIPKRFRKIDVTFYKRC